MAEQENHLPEFNLSIGQEEPEEGLGLANTPPFEEMGKLTPVKQNRKLPTEKEATEEAFYTTAAVDPQTVEGTTTIFNNVLRDLMEKGDSDLRQLAVEKFRQEEDEGNKQAIISVLQDPTLSRELKDKVLGGFVDDGFVSPSLKEKYIKQTAATAVDNTVEANERQDNIVANLRQRRKLNGIEKAKKDAEENSDKLRSFMTGFEHLYVSAGHSFGFVDDATHKEATIRYQEEARKNRITTGLGKVAGLLVGAGAAALSVPASAGVTAAIGAGAIAGGILDGGSHYADLGLTDVEFEDRLKASMARGGMTAVDLSIPILRAGTLVRELMINGFANVALGELDIKIQNEILKAFPHLQHEQFDPSTMAVNGVMGMLIAAAFHQKPKGIPEVDPGSPLGTTMTANPEMGRRHAMAALIRDEDDLANALGAPKGHIIGDYVVETPLLEGVPPKIAHDISTEFNRVFGEVLYDQFQGVRFDPNIHNATERLRDLQIISDIMLDERIATYKISNSSNRYQSIFNITDKISEGNMVFGPMMADGWDNIEVARIVRGNLQKEVDKLPKEEQSQVEIETRPDGLFQLKWHWKKEYDNIALNLFGKDAIDANIFPLGKETSNKIARSDLYGIGGRWLLPIGRNKELENVNLRAVERNAQLEVEFARAYEQNVFNTKLGKEFNTLIREAEDLGKNDFSMNEISGLFPHLKQTQVTDLLKTWTFWRGMQNVMHSFINRNKMNKLVRENMQGVYDADGNSLGFATTKVSQAEIDDLAANRLPVWDYSTNTSRVVDLKAFELEGKQIVRMNDRVELPNHQYHRFAIVGGDIKLDLLPNMVVPRIPGFSPREVKEYFFVERRPNRVTVDGRVFTDDATLKQFTRAEAGVRTEREAIRIQKEMRNLYPNDIIDVRPAREDSFGKLVDDYGAVEEMNKFNRVRGEQLLAGSHGEARLEDRAVTAIKTAKNVARMDTSRTKDNAFIDTFTRDYRKFLRDGEFPKHITDIQPVDKMTREDEVDFKNARTLFEYFYTQKNFETIGDVRWGQFFNGMADVFEKARVPGSYLRELADQGNLLVKYPKAWGSILFIHLSIPRQWTIQLQPMGELFWLDPVNALKMFNDILAIRMYLGGESSMVGSMAPLFKDTAMAMNSMSPKKFKDTIAAINDSGLFESIDKNLMVEGTFNEARKYFVRSPGQEMANILRHGTGLSAIQKGIEISKFLGYDSAEFLNRLGVWMQVRSIWEKQNPGKNWNTLENRETISAEATKLAGAMSSAGATPYQRGWLSIFMQFAKVQQQLTMNVLSDATLLTGKDRAKLAAARFFLYGGKYGLIGGSAIYSWIQESENPEIQAVADLLEIGLIDRIVNWLANTLIDPEIASEIALARGLSPHSENFLPMLDFIHTLVELYDGENPDNPRFPASLVVSNLGKTVDQVKSWFAIKDIDTLEKFKLSVLEIAELTSGMNNISKGLVILGMKDQVLRNGNKLGWRHSEAEAYAKMFGAPTNKELRTYEAFALMSEHNKKLDAVTETIHEILVNAMNKSPVEFEKAQERTNTIISMMSKSNNLTPADVLEVRRRLMNKDRKSHISGKQSLIGFLIDQRNNQSNPEVQQAKRILEKFDDDPDAKEAVNLLNGKVTKPTE